MGPGRLHHDSPDQAAQLGVDPERLFCLSGLFRTESGAYRTEVGSALDFGAWRLI